jgi:hypothetical protein
MKKLYVLILVAVFCSNLGFSQVLEALHPTLDYSGPANVKLTGHLDVRNNGPASLEVLCERFGTNMATGHYSYFCWTVCYDTSTYISPDPVIIASGATFSNFEGWAGTNNTPGHDEVTYRFYDQNGNSDTLYLIYTYDFNATGIKEYYANKYGLFITGPNPASNQTTVSFSTLGQKEGKLVITNLLGSKVDEVKINSKSNSLSLPVSSLNNGIYLLSLVVDGITTNSKKLIVSH